MSKLNQGAFVSVSRRLHSTHVPPCLCPAALTAICVRGQHVSDELLCGPGITVVRVIIAWGGAAAVLHRRAAKPQPAAAVQTPPAFILARRWKQTASTLSSIYRLNHLPFLPLLIPLSFLFLSLTLYQTPFFCLLYLLDYSCVLSIDSTIFLWLFIFLFFTSSLLYLRSPLPYNP